MFDRLCVILILWYYWTVEIVSVDISSCISQTTCDSCIYTFYYCTWCKDQNFPFGRCNTFNNLTDSGCNDIENPQKLVRSYVSLESAEYFTIVPNTIEARIRRYDMMEIPVGITLVKNLPSDMVFVMDFSGSMVTYWSSMMNLVTNVSSFLQLSAGARIGYTAFVDKTRYPVIDYNLYDESNPTNPFNFKIIHGLTNDPTSLYNAMVNQQISNNVDYPETSMDAILQTAICDQVGWSSDPLVSKTIILFTDATSKTAGEGTVAGVFRPHDMKCHINSNGIDQTGLTYDYPSLGQTKQVLKSKKAAVIFVTSTYLQSFYSWIRYIWRNNVNSYVTLLDTGSDSILQSIIAARNALNSQYWMSYSPTDDFTISINATCPTNDPQNTAQSCYNVPANSTVFFRITMSHLGTNDNNTMEFTISNFGKINFNFSTIRTCSCSNNLVNSTICGPNGQLKCGLCACNPGWFGSKCQCQNLGSATNATCISPQDNSMCSNRGTCNECGTCDCELAPDGVPYTGSYCQCGRSCPSYNGSVCGGPDRGQCVCDSCQCADEYTGSSCESFSCSYSGLVQQCMQNPDDNVVCSDAGQCTCGVCLCNSDSFGTYCEKKVVYDSCDEYAPYASCLVYNTPSPGHSECAYDEYEGSLVDEGTFSCSSSLSNGCRFYFNFDLSGNGTKVKISSLKSVDSRDCPQSVSPWAITGGVVAGVVIIGLLLLGAYMLTTYIYYKRSYQKLLAERDTAIKTGIGNPLYKTPAPDSTEI